MSAAAERLPSIPLFERSGLQEVKDRVRDIPVCLIIPDSDFLLDARVFPFIGILKVASELERNGNPVSVLDLSKYKNQEAIVAEFIREHPQLKTFGITATTPQIPAAVKIVESIKAINPEAVVVLGGPHVTLTYTGKEEDEKAKRIGRGTWAFEQLISHFDKLIVGDGEKAIFLAIDPQNTDHVINAGNLKTSLFLKRGELDNFLPPARHLIDHESYKYYINDDGKPYRAFSVIGQLGCPFGCGFCGGRDAQPFRMIRTRTIDNIVNEIEAVVRESDGWQEPLRGVMFYDDELNVSTGNLEELCKGLIDLQKRLGVEMRFRGFVKAERFSQEQADLMYEAGFRILLSGVESGSDRMLTAMKKGTSRVTNSDCVRFAHNAGLRFKALMSIGHPGESRRTINESIEWAKSNLLPGDDIDWTVITQYPGSPYFDKSAFDEKQKSWVYKTKVGKKIVRLWSHTVDFATQAEFYKGKPGDYKSYVWTDYLTADQLVVERDRAERVTRNALKLPTLQSVEELQYEHSMGQGLPANILRNSSVV